MNIARMGRVARFVALAATMIALSAAPVPNGVAGQQQSASAAAESSPTQNVAPANDEMAERAHRAKYEAQCDPGDDKRDSDLCAQWKAADAAADSAWWAAVGTWVSAVGSVLVLVALGFAFDANWIARDTAKRQLRAYLAMGQCAIKPVVLAEKFAVKLTLLNCGQTPARKVRWHSTLVFEYAGKEPEFIPIPLAQPGSASYIGPTEHTFHILASKIPLDERLFGDVTSGAVIPYVFGQVHYVDIFDKEHTLHFRYMYDREAHGLSAEPEGNDET